MVDKPKIVFFNDKVESKEHTYLEGFHFEIHNLKIKSEHFN